MSNENWINWLGNDSYQDTVKTVCYTLSTDYSKSELYFDGRGCASVPLHEGDPDFIYNRDWVLYIVNYNYR